MGMVALARLVRMVLRVSPPRLPTSAFVQVAASAALVLTLLAIFVPIGRANPSPPYYGPAVLSVSSLRGYWQLDETSGSTASDQSTSPVNGTYQGGVTLGQAGAITTTSGDHAVSFNGSNGYVSTPSASKLQPSTSLSLEAWFKTTSTVAYAPILSLGGPTTGCGARLYLSGGHVVANVACSTTQSFNVYNDGAWHYVSLTWTGSKLALYIDGALARPDNGQANPMSETTVPGYGTSIGVLIAKDPAGDFFNGSIDEAAVYGSSSDASGALSAGQIANHYSAATTGAVAAPVNIVAPTVSGRPLVGSTMTVTNTGSWNASTEIYGALSYSYQWLRCGLDGSGCSAIAGATSSAYTVVSDDGMHELSVQVIASDSGGSSSATVSLPVVDGYRSTVFTDGGSNLRGYWPLDEPYSYPRQQPVNDISDSPANGSYQMGAGQTSLTANVAGALTDVSDRAATFSAGDYVAPPSVSKLQPSASLSVEAWFKTTSTASIASLVEMGTGWWTGVRLELFSGHLYGEVNGKDIESAKTFNDGSWHYAVVTWDGSKVSLYGDGASVQPASGYSNPATLTSAPTYGGGVLIGEDVNPDYYVGSLDEIAIYGSNTDGSGALSGAQIANHFRLATLLAVPTSYTQGGGNDAVPGACNCAQNAADPVNTATGDFSESASDITVRSYGPAVSFSRTYDALLAQSQAKAGTPGALGYGWTDNWGASLTVNNGTATINQGDGAQVDFYPPVSGACQSPYVGSGASGTYCALPSVTASLTYDSSSSTYTFITHPYQRYTFDSSGRLTGQSGPGGAALTVSYGAPAPGSGYCPSSATSCRTISSASGRGLVLAFNSSSQVTKVTDPLGRAWTYAYCSPPSGACSANDLVSVTDPLGRVTSYTYDQGNANTALKHDLLTITRPNGQTGGPNAGAKTVNVYDASGRVSSQTDPAGNQTTLDYSHLNTGLGYVVVTDPDGIQTKSTYSQGVLTAQTVGFGSSAPATTGYQPDSSTLLDTQVTDPTGAATSYSYSTAGNITSTTDPLGQTASFSYNSFDEPTCAAAALAAQPCSALTPPSAITAGSSPIAPPASVPPAYVTFSEYDTNGDLIWTTAAAYNPGSPTASFERTSYNLYNGQSVTLGANTDSCTTTAPSSSFPCATIDANGAVTQLDYDSAGDVTSTSTPDGNPGSEVAKTTYVYDGDGEQTSVTAPKGNLSGALAGDYTTTTIYDAEGAVTSVTVGQSGGSVTPRTTSYGYDGNGNRTSVTNARSKTTTYTFNANDQLVLVTDPDNQATLTCYDGDGNIAQTVPPVGVAAGSLTPSSCPMSYPSSYGNRLASDATTFTYNALNQKTSSTTPAPAGLSGSETTSWTYDGDGRVLSITAPPTSNAGGAPNQVTTYSYDSDGNTLTATSGYGTSAASTTSYCYDPDGEKTATVPPDGNTSSVASCSSSSPYQTSSSYQTAYSYDSLGALYSKTRPATTWASSGQTTSYTYDPAGNLLTSEDPNGITTTNTYTPLNQLATVSYSGSSAHSVTYGYDANGNRLTMIDGTGTSTYGYDPFNELTSYENGAGNTVRYSYNDDGRTTGITYPLGSPSWATTSTVSYGYDNADQLTSIGDFGGNTVTVGNTADGLPSSLALGSTGDTISTTYDPTDTPSQITLANSGGTLLQFAYSDMPSGAISSESDTPSWTGSPASYAYDAQSRVTQMTPGAGSALSYGFDASGNPTTLPTGASGSYDNASELTSSVLSGTTTSYTYDADGERTQATVGGSTVMSASYDGAERLTSYDNAAADMSTASYDGDGLRQSDTTTPTGGSAVTENFTWNPSSSVPELLMDSDNAYIYGDGAGNTPVEQVNLSSGSVTYLVADLLGSLRGIVNGATGSLTASTAYDAWGNPETTGGLSSYTPFGYAGSYTDQTGLSYLIGRYYDPTTGQFLTVDALVDNTGAPYAYAGDNPVLESDPTGACAGGVLSGGILNFGPNLSWGDGGIAVPFPPAPIPIPIPKPSVTGLGAAAVAAIVVASSGGAQTAKPQMLYRFGFAWESAATLEEAASAAEAAGFPHGVSVLSKLPPGRSASRAVRASVEAHFAVVKTGNNPYHYTVVLPKPVTERDAATFNTLFGRLAA